MTTLTFNWTLVYKYPFVLPELISCFFVLVEPMVSVHNETNK